MRTAVTVSIPEDLNQELTRFVKKRRSNRSAVIKMALQDYLFKNQFLEVRDRLVPKARAKGIYTDEDVAGRLK